MNKNILTDIIDCTALGLIGFYVLGCVFGGSNFSEIHLSLNFLNFPIFIGEIFIAICLLLLWWKYQLRPIIWNLWQAGVWVGLLMVVMKALWDYGHWGPLSFRNAAMYYYPIFILFAYVFFNVKWLLRIAPFISILCVYLLSVFMHSHYFWFTSLAVFLICVNHIQPKKYRLIVWALFLLFCKYEMLFAGSRTNLMGTVAAVIFIGSVYLMHFMRISGRYKGLITGMFVGIFLLGLILFADKNGLKSLYDINEMYRQYQNSKERIAFKKQFYVYHDIKPKLYNDNKNLNKVDVKKSASAYNIKETYRKYQEIRQNIDAMKERRALALKLKLEEERERLAQLAREKERLARKVVVPQAPLPVPTGKIVKQGPALPPPPMPKPKPVQRLSKHVPKPIMPPQPVREATILDKRFEKADSRPLSGAQGNAVFRILIWEDMVKEVIKERAIFGIGFGKPQRSISLETIGWGTSEWIRDGWIAPHNGILHVIYRLGIIGLMLIVIVFICLKNLVTFFVKRKLWKGVLLTSVLVYWLMASNFLVILELPHYAITFWSVWGLALAYAHYKESIHA